MTKLKNLVDDNNKLPQTRNKIKKHIKHSSKHYSIIPKGIKLSHYNNGPKKLLEKYNDC